MKLRKSSQILVLILVISFLSPIIVRGIFKIYEYLSFVSVGKFNFDIPITLDNAIYYFLLTINTGAVSILAYLSYDINRQQFDLLQELKYTKPEIILKSKKIKIHFPIEDYPFIRDDYRTCSDNELRNVFEKDSMKLFYPLNIKNLNFQIPLFIHNSGDTTVIIENVSIFIEGVTTNSIYSELIVEQEIEGKNVTLTDADEFSYLPLCKHETISKIFKFMGIPMTLKEGNKYEIVITLETNFGNYKYISSFVYKDLKSDISRFINTYQSIFQNLKSSPLVNNKGAMVHSIKAKLNLIFKQGCKSPQVTKLHNTIDVDLDKFTKIEIDE